VNKTIIDKAFFIAAHNGHTNLVSYLIDFYKRHYYSDTDDIHYRALQIGIHAGHYKFAKTLVIRKEMDTELSVHLCSDSGHFCERRPLIEGIVANTLNQMRFIENAPVFNTTPPYRFLVDVVKKNGCLNNEKNILFIITQFEHEKSRKHFLEQAKSFLPIGCNVHRLLFRANQIYSLQQKNVLEFDQVFTITNPQTYALFSFISQTCHENYLNINLWAIVATYLSPFHATDASIARTAVKQDMILDGVKECVHSINKFRHPSQRKKTSAFFDKCDRESRKHGLDGLMRIIDKVKPDDQKLYPVVSKYQS
jgi:hypothetical protein